MRLLKFLREDAAQLAIPGMSTKRPHVWGDNDPDRVAGEQCPPEKIWSNKEQKCISAKPKES